VRPIKGILVVGSNGPGGLNVPIRNKEYAMSNVISSMAMTARQSAIRSSANQRECQIYRELYAHEQRMGPDSGLDGSDRAHSTQISNDHIGDLRDADERLD